MTGTNDGSDRRTQLPESPSLDMVEADPMPAEAEIVVVGAGHNSLVCAAYLAAAGLEVLVLEASAGPGGNTRTEELTLPGFAHDSCSSAHVLIQGNPLIRDDELGLVSRYGLTYLTTDPAVVMPLDDGDTLVMRPDLEATCNELARFSARDAASLRTLMEQWHDGLATAHGRWSSGLAPRDDAAGQRYRSLRAQSAWDVVHERFEHPVARDFMLWLAMATIQDPRRPGTGFLPSSLTAGRLAFGWTTPVGGSQALPDALIRSLEHHGGRVVCSSPVTAVVADVDGVRKVRTVDGRSVRATRAVVAGSHLAQLGSMVEGVDVPDDLRQAGAAWRPGLSVFAVHAALRDDLTYGRAGMRSTAAGLGSSAGFVAQVDAHNRGEPDARDPWLLVVDQTVADPSRAPADGGATFKILTLAPYERRDGRDWADAKQEYAEQLVDLVRRRATGLEEASILAWRAESPVDVSAHNPFNLGGSCHGGEFVVGGRVIPGWRSHRTGVPGLFVTGATSHPGGSVSGRPGRNAARTVLTELGIDPLTVMGST